MKLSTKMLASMALSTAVTSVLAAAVVDKSTFSDPNCIGCAGNCTIYARSKVPQLPHGLTLFTEKQKIINRKIISEKGDGCKEGSIAIISVSGKYAANGHVAYVEKCNGSGITITEGNFPDGKLGKRVCSGSITECETALNIEGYYDPNPSKTPSSLNMSCSSPMNENSTGSCSTTVSYSDIVGFLLNY
jgi:hypothetical protein